jgi:hypothetical protein
MYRVEFGQYEKLTLYIFSVVDGVIPDRYLGFWNLPPVIQFVDVTGARVMARLRFDETKDNRYYPSEITKQSLEVELIRENEDDFYDIIDGNDNEWYALVTEGDTHLATKTKTIGVGEFAGIPIVKGQKVRFLGRLNNEQYGETYNHNSPVKLVFHDRLGELDQTTFKSNDQLMSLPDILHDLLQPVLAKRHLHIEFPYDIDYTVGLGGTIRYKNLENPDRWYLDISEHVNDKRLAVLEKILKDHDLTLHVDFTQVKISENDYSFLEDIGAVRIEHIDQFTEGEREFFVYESDDDNYILDPTKEQISNPPILLRHEYLIINKSGRWRLVRRAKWIDSKALLATNTLVFPEEISEDTVVPSSELSPSIYRAGFYPYYSLHHARFVGSSNILKEDSLNLVMNAGVFAGQIGVVIRDNVPIDTYDIHTRRIPIVKGTDRIRAEFTMWANYNAIVRVGFLAWSPYTDEVFNFGTHLSPTERRWEPWSDLEPLVTTLLFLTGTFNEDGVTATRELSMPPPPFTDPEATNSVYYIVPIMGTGNTRVNEDDKFLMLNDLKLQLLTEKGVPKSITLRTNISESRRSPIEETFTFSNLPRFKNDQSFYRNGIYAKGLDLYINDVLQSEKEDNVVAPRTVLYKQNNATMLVHNSEARGRQMLDDRWLFTARVKAFVDEGLLLYFATWNHSIDFVCEIDEGENTGYKRALTLLVSKSLAGQSAVGYPKTYELTETEIEIAEMSTIDYIERTSALVAFASSIELQELNPNNSPRVQNLTSCPLPAPAPTQFLTAAIQYGGLVADGSGLGGSFDFLDSSDVVKETSNIVLYSQDIYKVFIIQSGGNKFDFSDIEVYELGVQKTVVLEWRVQGETSWNETLVTDTYTQNTIIEVRVNYD